MVSRNKTLSVSAVRYGKSRWVAMSTADEVNRRKRLPRERHEEGANLKFTSAPFSRHHQDVRGSVGRWLLDVSLHNVTIFSLLRVEGTVEVVYSTATVNSSH